MKLPFLKLTTVAICAAGIVIGAFFSLLGELWWKTYQPILMVVHSIDVTDLPAGDRVMLVTSSGPPAKDCIRFTQHLIYRDGEPRPPDADHKEQWILRDYTPLAMAMNGLGFSSVADFRVRLYVPPEVGNGMWIYQSRSLYLCTVFPGLARFSQSASKPYQIELN